MKVLVLGGSGMLGHRAVRALALRHETGATYRSDAPRDLDRTPPQVRRFVGVDVRDVEMVARIVEESRPAAVVNCVGVVKQRAEASDPVASIAVNALFPHQLAAICGRAGTRLVHLSTDCVFSGRSGPYDESSIPDPVDLYGRSKLLGEPEGPHCLTLRTSMVGWETGGAHGLLEWFAAQRGLEIAGYERAVFSGLPTSTLAELIADLLERHPGLAGTFHVASEAISKLDLLSRLRDELGWHDIRIRADRSVAIDRSLRGDRLRAATGWVSPGWDELVRRLASERSDYQSWRSSP